MVNEMQGCVYEEKLHEGSSLYHIKKPALAYGLIDSPARTGIRGVGNLWVLRSCHSALKITSNVYARENAIKDKTTLYSICSKMDLVRVKHSGESRLCLIW
ncbi:unnamed protein product [Ilex paraguariensis]|uniref:DYW domain-containing protein n=1 Tax=Ilex paraguariensis TaxID=185542 RepID=A0ABC8TFF1_9AQUA